ncbi:MAG: hypothetical protein IPL65_11425 [Lewinellaceae bacterium]|nr:hypothetical protein [Lewinellaceae bacterium]
MYAYLKNCGYIITFGQYLNFTGKYIPVTAPSTSGGNCQELKCDFTVDDIETQARGWGTGYGNAEVNEGRVQDVCGLTSKSSVMVEGRCEQFSATGENVTIQPGMEKVEVSTKLQQYSFSGDSNPGFNMGYGYADCGISINGEGLEKIFIFDSAFGFSPFGSPSRWFLFEKTNQFVKTEFIPQAAGGNYEIQVFARTSAESGGFGTGSGECIVVHPEYIKVCQFAKK